MAEIRTGARGRPGPWVMAGALLTALLAGCATLPASGVVQSASIPSGPGSGAGGRQSCCGLLMSPPKSGWDPQQIVSNFLLASANFADDHGIARDYLTAAASKAWHPGSAVTVIKQPPVVTLYRGLFGAQSQSTAVIQIQAQEVATLSGSGQYTPVPGGQQRLTRQFGLQLVNHRWRIASLPPSAAGSQSSELLLTKDVFQLEYEPRNLYYFDPSYQVLVPDPIFVPVDSSDPGTGLVRALLGSPSGWLGGAAVSAFPVGARLLRPVQISPGSKIAIVDLRLPPGTAARSRLRSMAAQLAWTLTSPSYSPAPAQAVQLEVNQHSISLAGTSTPVEDRNNYPQKVLGAPGHENLYFLAANGAARELRGAGPVSTALPGEAGTGQVPLRMLAVSPDEHYLAGIAGAGSSTTVYISDLVAATQNHPKPPGGNLVSRLSGGTFTALSWDRKNELWVAGKMGGQSGVWAVTPGSAQPVPVSLPLGTGTVTALRVAPDGVRVAMIADSTTGARLLLGAVVRGNGQISVLQTVAVGADVSDPSALTWYDADHLLVVAQSAAGSGLDEVPVDGDRSTAMGVQPSMVSITAAGPANALYAGLQTNPSHLVRSIGVGELWNSFGAGSSASYPG